MPGDFEFRAQQDLLSRLSREVEALKRQAASGVQYTIELPILGSGGGNIEGDGPVSGGFRTDVYRHNEFVHLTMTGGMTSTTATSALYVTTPWTHLVAGGSYALVGRYRGYHAATGGDASGNVFAYHNTNQLIMIGDGGGQVSATSPFTWQAGDYLYFFADLRLVPGT